MPVLLLDVRTTVIGERLGVCLVIDRPDSS